MAALLNFGVALFAIINPIGNVPVYISYTTAERSGVQRFLAVLTGVAILAFTLAFMFTGDFILELFGITIPAFRIAGGIIILLMGINMIRGHSGPEERSGTTVGTGDDYEEAKAVLGRIMIPVVVPILVGPGVISTVIVYGHQAKQIGDLLDLSIVAAVVCAVITVILLAGQSIKKLLGENGLSIATRIMGLILAAIAMQFILHGLADATVNFINPKILH